MGKEMQFSDTNFHAKFQLICSVAQIYLKETIIKKIADATIDQKYFTGVPASLIYGNVVKVSQGCRIINII